MPDSICPGCGHVSITGYHRCDTPTAVTYDEEKTQAHVNGGEMSFDGEAHVCEIHEA